MKDAKIKSKIAYNKKADNYDNLFEGKFTQEYKEKLMGIIDIKDNDVVLDIACGNGTLLNMMSNSKKIEAYGVDISDKMIQNAKKRYANINFQISECDNLPFEESYFNFATVCVAYHHFPDVDAFAEEVNRVLKSKGLIYIAEVYYPMFIRLFFNILLPFSESGDVKFYTPKEIVNTFKKHNFNCKSIHKKGRIEIICLQKNT